MENTDDIKIAGLISRHLLGQATPEEERRLEQWLAASEEHREMYGRLVGGSSLRARLANGKEPDIQAELNSIYARARSKKRLRAVRRTSVAVGTAAVILVAAMAPWRQAGQPDTQPSIYAPDILRVELLGDNLEPHMFYGSADTVIRQGAAAIVNRGNTLVFTADAETAEVTHHTVNVPHGSEYNLELSDGTHIYLYPGSSIHFPSRFTGDVREVRLEGEGYFDVAQTGEPFIVRAHGDMTVRVYGTAFNVAAYPGEATVEATLVRGSISVEAPAQAGREYRLTPGQQAVWDTGSAKLAIREVDTAPYGAWQQDVFLFDEVDLGAIMRRLSRWYGVDIVVESPELSAMSLYMKVPKHESLTAILDRVKAVNNFTYTVAGDKVILRKE